MAHRSNTIKPTNKAHLVIPSLLITARILLCKSRPIGGQHSAGRPDHPCPILLAVSARAGWRLPTRALPHSGEWGQVAWWPRILAPIGHRSRPLLLAQVAKDERCQPPAHHGTSGQGAEQRTFYEPNRWPSSDHYFIILFNYSYLEFIFWLLLWICYDH